MENKITLDEAWKAYVEIMELVENRLHGAEGRATLYHYFKQQSEEQEQFENMDEFNKVAYLLKKLDIEVLGLGRSLDVERNLFTYEIKGIFELDYNLRHLALIPKRYISGVRTPKETHDYIADGIGYCLKHTLGDDYEKFALGRVTGFNTGHINIPSKIVFDEKLGRTTLLFGEKPYKSVVNAKAKTLSKFNFALGVKIALLKYFYTDSEVKEIFDLAYNNFKKDKIEPYFDKLLKEKLHFLSEYQYNKLFSTKLLDGEIILDIKGYGRHIIEIERK